MIHFVHFITAPLEHNLSRCDVLVRQLYCLKGVGPIFWSFLPPYCELDEIINTTLVFMSFVWIYSEGGSKLILV